LKPNKYLHSKTILPQQVFEKGAKGLYVIQHSDCDNCEKDEGWTWMKGRSDVKKSCWTIDLTTKNGPFNLPLNCEYFKANDQNCKVDFSKSGMKDAPSGEPVNISKPQLIEPCHEFGM
jgi:hypothetical protein